MEPWSTGARLFGPADGEMWPRYVAWIGLTQLGGLVRLDPTRCPRILDEVKGFRSDHVVQEGHTLRGSHT